MKEVYEAQPGLNGEPGHSPQICNMPVILLVIATVQGRIRKSCRVVESLSEGSMPVINRDPQEYSLG
jgi:hypothetical protein